MLLMRRVFFVVIRVVVVLVAVAGVIPGLDLVPRLAGWGAHGHTTAARAAVRTLPESMPAFFRAAEDQLVYLNPEPDRWRDRLESKLDETMNAYFTPDHWIHLDEIPKELQEAPNRYDFIVNLSKARLDPKEMGTLPYRIVEMTQRVRSRFRRWRQETDPAARQWIQQRIVNDAGILGHYVTDGSNPHHTSMHHNGWVGPNPRNFTPVAQHHGRRRDVARPVVDGVDDERREPRHPAAVTDQFGISSSLLPPRYFVPVTIDVKLRQPCSATITRWPGMKAARPHIAAKCQMRVARKPPRTATSQESWTGL
jgi:hypothetical protein